MKHQPTINIYNQDCMEAMFKMEDNAFDLAIVDPPYGIKAGEKTKYHSNSITRYISKEWDKIAPDKSYFYELFRVSKNQIIWGANYFVEHLPVSNKWIVWDKKQPEGIDQAMFELAFNSNNKIQAKIFRRIHDGNRVSNNKLIAKLHSKIHPTQKPVALYKWLLKNYANEGDRILDTHLGSGSIAIACHDMGYDLEGYEIDQEYYQAALQRLNTHRSQLQMF